MARRLKPLDVERKIRPGKFCASWQRSGVNPCPRPDWLRGMSGYGMTPCGAKRPLATKLSLPPLRRSAVLLPYTFLRREALLVVWREQKATWEQSWVKPTVRRISTQDQ
jgi:hypothetical protein